MCFTLIAIQILAQFSVKVSGFDTNTCPVVEIVQHGGSQGWGGGASFAW